MEIFLILSVPFFYLLGVISFVRFFINKNNSNSRIEFLEKLTAELKDLIRKTPQKRLQEALDEYNHELSELSKIHLPEQPVNISSTIHPQSKLALDQNMESIWSNWYSHNSINLLLYIGAFLIVSSASIFVGFQWESISGSFKALMITIFTLLFLGVGLTFYQYPKIKSAGMTFTAIGSLLIPLIGMAWYNFVLKDLNIDVGVVWFCASALAQIAYMILIFYFRHYFYSYITGLSVISLMLSLVNVFNLDNDYYILMGILSALVLLIASKLKTNLPKESQIYSFPLEISANITMPAALIFGLINALSSDRLFSFEATFSVFLAIIYYGSAYQLLKEKSYATIAQILTPILLIIFFRWQQIDDTVLLYSLNILALMYLALSNFLKERLSFESDSFAIVGQFTSIFTLILGLTGSLDPVDQTMMAYIPGLIAVGNSWIKQKAEYLIVSCFSFALTIHIFCLSVLRLSDQPYIASFILVGLSLLYFGLLTVLKNHLQYVQVLTFSIGLFISLGFIYSREYPEYLAILSAFTALLLLVSSIWSKKSDLIFGSNLFIYFGFWQLLNALNIQFAYYPLIFSTLSYLLYFVYWTSTDEIKEKYLFSAVAGVSLTPIIFGTLQFDQPNSNLELFSLMSAYAATVLLSLEGLIKKNTPLIYGASAAAMLTLLWQINYLGVTELQAYSIPVALYFFALALINYQKSEIDRRAAFDYVGLFCLFGPSIIQSFDTDGAKYALLFGIQGMVLVFSGISLKHKLYLYAGVAGIVLAVFSQTYDYLFSLPRWIVTGIAGIGFLGLAVFLLLKRKED